MNRTAGVAICTWRQAAGLSICTSGPLVPTVGVATIGSIVDPCGLDPGGLRVALDKRAACPYVSVAWATGLACREPGAGQVVAAARDRRAAFALDMPAACCTILGDNVSEGLQRPLGERV